MKRKAQSASKRESVDHYVTKRVLFCASLVDVSSLRSSVAGLVPRSETTTRPGCEAEPEHRSSSRMSVLAFGSASGEVHFLCGLKNEYKNP